MPINLRPLSDAEPLLIEEAEYDRLVRNRAGGWSNCAEEIEWLAKLHYLRSGHNAGRLERAQFEERETRLVEAWLRKGA